MALRRFAGASWIAATVLFGCASGASAQTAGSRTIDDEFTVAADTSVQLPVLANDVLTEGWELTGVQDPTAAGGSASVDAGQVLYRPAEGYVGADEFSYEVCQVALPADDGVPDGGESQLGPAEQCMAGHVAISVGPLVEPAHPDAPDVVLSVVADGTVTDARNGQPLAGVTVTLVDAAGASFQTSTTALGDWQLVRPPDVPVAAGPGQLHFAVAGYTGVAVPVQIGDTRATIDVTLQPAVVAAPTAAAELPFTGPSASATAAAAAMGAIAVGAALVREAERRNRAGRRC